MQVHPPENSAAERRDQAELKRPSINRYDIAARLLEFWWLVLAVWAGLTLWVFASLGGR